MKVRAFVRSGYLTQKTAHVVLQELASCSERVERLMRRKVNLQSQQADLHTQLATVKRKASEIEEDTKLVTASVARRHGSLTQQLAILSQGQNIKVQGISFRLP
jgi:uncharacterized protein (UPF0335 family)